ncbi:MAG: cupin-like domain-containing protein [Leptolyngbya sp. DLM2.Bin15]|nr:MAG: cupin-like domain-containing protein [Leptolyngbya sp. DLM2.Bin15]
MVAKQSQQQVDQDVVSSHLDPSKSSVERVIGRSLSRQEFYQRYRKPGKPVVISGLLDDQADWDLDYLTQKLGDQVFPVRHYGRSRYQQDKRQWTSTGSGVKAVSLPFSTYADLLRSGEALDQDLYLARCTLRNTPLEHEDGPKQVERYLGFDKFPATYLNVWVGPGGHTSCLHYDPMDGLLMQMHGAKRLILFPPSQTYNLYPFPLYKQLLHGLTLRPVYSQVYPENPDYQAFPKFRQAKQFQQEVILNPGEVLFLPAGWWHEVSSLGDGMVCSVNRFWNVLPPSRALTSWNKWRAHLGSLFASPHIAWNLLTALVKNDYEQGLRKLLQQL